MNPSHNTGNKDTCANATSLSIHSHAAANSAFTKPWIFDSEVSDHIVSDSSLLTNTRSHRQPLLICPQGPRHQSFQLAQ